MHEFPLIATIAAGFTAAWVFGLITQRVGLSPIVGYLLAGVMIGPHTPGFRGDIGLAHQLSEVGVILLMFGVGLHFNVGDLMAVKGVVVPGALLQCAAATAAGLGVCAAFGIDLGTGAVVGVALSVASTVVLMRVLTDSNTLTSPVGHIAVGWSLVQDVVTVVVLVLIPVLGQPAAAEHAAGEAAPVEPGFWGHPVVAVGLALVKLAALVAVVLVGGARVVPWVLTRVARLRSKELFTLTVLVFSVAIAAGSYALFGASMALGAFLAGMVVAQSAVSHQAAADALPLRDAFAVLFFVSVGMIFDPMFLIRQPLLMLAALGVILLVKPLVALLTVLALGHSSRTALVVALGLATVGEFSFILSDLARKHGLMTDDGHNVLVGGAILSITLNPLLFRSIDGIERLLRRRPKVWGVLNARAERRAALANAGVAERMAALPAEARLAVVVGYGPVGRTVERLLREAGLTTVVIDLNTDTVADLHRQGKQAVYGDAAREAILEAAGVERATHLVLTLPQAADRSAVVATARMLNPTLKIFVRARYLQERGELEQVGATAAIFEEAEAAVALARLVLADAGAGRESIEATVRDVRTRLILENVSALRGRPVSAVMVPWTRVRRLSAGAPLNDVRRLVREQHFSRWPVVGDGGQPVGYLLAKDLIGVEASADWAALVRPLAAVNPDDDLEAVLQFFQREGATVCLVRDGTLPVGIVTVEDVIEQVVGRLEDEYPRAPRLSLPDLLVTDDALLNLHAGTAEQAITELARAIPPDRLPAGVDAAALVSLAVERERDMSTDLGCGVAIPHARCPGLSTPLVVFGRSADGVVYDPQGGGLVFLVFLLVTPAGQANVQVPLLAQVARVAGDPELRGRLRAAGTPGEVAEVLAAGATSPPA
jgi:CPA2 family monovalent cation:H+ antiporter-2